MIDIKILEKILYLKNQYFPSNDKTIYEINNEPFRYKISNTKMYIFEKSELNNFLLWYYESDVNEFIIDICSYNSKIIWKYFIKNIDGFINDYKDFETFEKEIIENKNMTEIIKKYFEIRGINHFINNINISKNINKEFEFKCFGNTIYKFATKNLSQIFM